MTFPINGPGRWMREGDWRHNADPDDGLPRREPTPLSEAETGHVYTTADSRYDDAAQAFRDRWAEQQGRPADVLYDAPDTNVTMLEGPNTPTWNGFDTFLRRALMVGGNILVWTILTMCLLLAFGSGYILSRLGAEPAQPAAPYEQPLLPDPTWACNPDLGEC